MKEETENYRPKFRKGDIVTDGKNTYEVLYWDYTEIGEAAYYMEGCGRKFLWLCEEADRELRLVGDEPATDNIPIKVVKARFLKVQIYCDFTTGADFSNIRDSSKPEILINVDHIVSLGEKTDWGFCDGHSKYPYRILRMVDGRSYLCVLESANFLEACLLFSQGE